MAEALERSRGLLFFCIDALIFMLNVRDGKLVQSVISQDYWRTRTG